MRISVITPSFNQGSFIERTIKSVLNQTGDFELEYFVVDGGSSDGTLDILRRYEPRLQWRSEPDHGQSDAINKGLGRATGELLAWLNSDDTYLPGALNAVADAYRRRRFAWCFGNCRIVDEQDREIRGIITGYKVWQSRHYSYRRLLRRDFIPQPAVFFARTAYQETGELDRALTYSMDYDYWLKLGRRWAPCYIDAFLANFRWHTKSKNGAAYRAAAWETLQTARHHAPRDAGFDVFLHRVHYCMLNVLYRFL
jgi:glycosyltransferase involved in cell wall biosynthesis